MQQEAMQYRFWNQRPGQNLALPLTSLITLSKSDVICESQINARHMVNRDYTVAAIIIMITGVRKRTDFIKYQYARDIDLALCQMSYIR